MSHSFPDQDKIQKSLRLSLADGFLYCLMIGLGESYLPAFALSLGMSEFLVALMATLPMVSGAFLQLLTTRGLRHMQNPRSWVVLLSSLQAFSFLPLVYLSYQSQGSFWIMLISLTLYWGATFSTNPVWTYWMGHLIPHKLSDRFFARRTSVNQAGILLGLVIGGLALHGKVAIGIFNSAFAFLFFAGFAARLVSSFLLTRQHYDEKWSHSQHPTLKEAFQLFRKNKVKSQFFLYLFPFQFCVFLSSPFVAPYFLAQVKLEYMDYMWAIGALFTGKIISLQIIQRFKNNLSGLRLIILSLGVISGAPMFWSVSQDLGFIIGLQMISGAAWALMEIGLSLVFFKDLSHSEKIPFMLIYNLINSVAIISGSLVGGLLLPSHPVINDYYMLFYFGSGLRLAMMIPLLRKALQWETMSVSGRGAVDPGESKKENNEVSADSNKTFAA